MPRSPNELHSPPRQSRIPDPLLSPAQTGDETLVTFSWLLYLRWGAIACQAILIGLVALFLPTALPGPTLALILVFGAVSNIIFLRLIRKRRAVPICLFTFVMFLDVGLLTIILADTGGAMNPFTFLYLVHIVVGAILLRPRAAWFLAGTSILLYLSLFLWGGETSSADPHGMHHPPPTPVCDEHAAPGSNQNLNLHLPGMFIAYSITVLCIMVFISQIRRALEQYASTVSLLEAERIKNEKLAALATLAAGAAHEFSTPLSTIAVAAGDILHAARQGVDAADLSTDAQLIKTQVGRCRSILDQLVADAGSQQGELPQQVSADEIMAGAVELLPEGLRPRVRYDGVAGIVAFLPRRACLQALKGIIKNGLDASAETGSMVRVVAEQENDFLAFTVIDQGIGMDEETARRATEPFFTTKEPGQGMGLGLYLASSTAERLGGRLAIDSSPGVGTRVTLRLPLQGTPA